MCCRPIAGRTVNSNNPINFPSGKRSTGGPNRAKHTFTDSGTGSIPTTVTVSRKKPRSYEKNYFVLAGNRLTK